jgi:hypothetical protein
MNVEELKVWRQAMDRIGSFLSKARKFMLVGDERCMAAMLRAARNVYDGVKYLKPPVPTPVGAIKPTIITKPPPIRGNPVNIEELRMKGGISLRSPDPMLILQLREMLLDFAYWKWGTPEQQQQHRVDQDINDVYWIDVINGRRNRTYEESRQDYYRKNYT